MSDRIWFDDIPVLAMMPFDEAAAKLRAMGELEASEAPQGTKGPESYGSGGLQLSWGKPRAWQHTAHAFGHIAPAQPGTDPLPIRHAGNIKPQASLRDARIKLTLNMLRAADYPGSGRHSILFDFYARNQVKEGVEDLHFNLTCDVQQGERAAILNLPIFVGLNVGGEGIVLKCRTVNVHNEDDQKMLEFLKGDVFRAGLKLAVIAQPAIAPLTQMAMGLTETLLKRNQNVGVQDIQLGLDFSNVPGGARLAQGTYLAVQIPEALKTMWDWNDWVYTPQNGMVVHTSDHTQLIPYNYVAIGVSEYKGQ
jgi:hypothetical protein